MKNRFNQFLLFSIFLALYGCEGGIDLSGTEKEDLGVNVNMTINLTNGSTSDAYMLADNETSNEETLVQAGAARTTTLSLNLSSDSRFEHTYDLLIRARWGEGNYKETTHVVDYKNYTLTMQGLNEPPLLNLQINVTFDGEAITVTETQI